MTSKKLAALRAAMQLEVNSLNAEAVPLAYAQEARDYFRRAIENGTYVGIVAELEGELVANAGGGCL